MLKIRRQVSFLSNFAFLASIYELNNLLEHINIHILKNQLENFFKFIVKFFIKQRQNIKNKTYLFTKNNTVVF